MTEPNPQESKPNQQQKSLFRLPVQKNSQILALFAIACTAIVGLVNELTKDQIKAQAQRQLLNTLHSIIEPHRYDNDITQDCVNFSSAPLEQQINSTMQTAYIARQAGKAVAIAMTNTAPDGYNGDIDLIVAINMDDSINGVRVLKHKETPGLGDKVELRKSNWITNFNGKEIESDKDKRWAVAKDDGMFDQFTGATITPRAVVKSVKQTLLYFKANKHALLTRPNACMLDNEQVPQNIEVNNDKQ
ncbi:MAG: electron transport complex subunit RsxG [Colwellia sp.]|nr:electron transport complex subunit RsxG [Colwellia sp.]MCW9081619.1 electron transport complex subunit RsxG [Colwellia sp.]